jgi:hypothetical protein
MTRAASVASFLLAIAISACATDNGPDGFSGGFSASPVGEDGFYASFRGNGFTSPETIQDYWLYNCAVLALSRGYDGFEVASASVAVSDPGSEPPIYPFPVGGAVPYLANRLAFNLASGSALYNNIKMVRRPFVHNPPKLFDAALVKAALEPYVTGKKCTGGNICPHPNDYLKPTTAADR